jgi:hypothetical protein
VAQDRDLLRLVASQMRAVLSNAPLDDRQLLRACTRDVFRYEAPLIAGILFDAYLIRQKFLNLVGANPETAYEILRGKAHWKSGLRLLIHVKVPHDRLAQMRGQRRAAGELVCAQLGPVLVETT